MMVIVGGVFIVVYGILLVFVYRAQNILRKQYSQLSNLSLTDGLTGIPNRRGFDEYLNQEWLRAVRTKTAVSLIMIDVDHFKAFNDHYGHSVGDDCLKAIAQEIAHEQAGDRDRVHVTVSVGGARAALHALNSCATTSPGLMAASCRQYSGLVSRNCA